METFKQRLKQDLLPDDPGGPEAQSIVAQARQYAEEMAPGGYWKDIDYQDAGVASWLAANHVGRIATMAKGYRLAGRTAVPLEKISKSLDWWLSHELMSCNWWNNDIGVPRALYPALVLLKKYLSPPQMQGGLAILGRGYKNDRWLVVNSDATGANLVWIAGLQFIREILRNDANEAARHIRRLAAEIRVATAGEDGIQGDWSFWQHGPILYSGSYGRAFLLDCARFAALVRGTRFAFPPETLAVLSNCMLYGQIWMCRGSTFDPSACGREISRLRKDACHTVSRACHYMTRLDGKRRREFARASRAIGAGQVAWKGEPAGNRHFWKSDFMVHRRARYYVSVKMASTRTVGTESGNGENLLGCHLAEGCTYIMRRGDEYDRIFPFWDWRRVPGITCELSRGKIPEVPWGKGARGTTAFVGGVSDGTYGVAVFDLNKHGVCARKSWFCFENEIVCLGAGISCKGTSPVATSVNQCRRIGTVATSEGEKNNGVYELAGTNWVHHDGVGYVFPAGATRARLQVGPRKGCWRWIDAKQSDEILETDVFALALDHGVKPKDGAYVYAIVPGVEASDMPSYVKDNGAEILANTTDLQAVRQRKLKLTGTVFFKPGKLAAPGVPSIESDQSAVVLLRELPGSRLSVALCKPDAAEKCVRSVSLTIGGSRVVFDLPEGEQAGRSIVKRWGAKAGAP